MKKKSAALRTYDITIDAFRDATQYDLDLAERAFGLYGKLIVGLKEILAKPDLGDWDRLQEIRGLMAQSNADRCAALAPTEVQVARASAIELESAH